MLGPREIYELHEPTFNEIHKLFQSAKEAIKEIEQRHLDENDENDGTLITAEDQLLFAGLHLSRAVKASFSLKNFYYFNEQVTQTKFHCQKARNYAYLFGIRDCLTRIEIFANGFTDTSLLNIVPNYPLINTNRNEVEKFIKQGDIIHGDYELHYKKTYKDLLALEAVREELAKTQKEEKSRKRLAIFTLFIAFLAALGTIIGAGVSFYKDVWVPNTSQGDKNSPKNSSSFPPQKATDRPPTESPFPAPATSPS